MLRIQAFIAIQSIYELFKCIYEINIFIASMNTLCLSLVLSPSMFSNAKLAMQLNLNVKNISFASEDNFQKICRKKFISL